MQMQRILNRIRQLLAVGPSVILSKLMARVMVFLKSSMAWVFGTTVSNASFHRALSYEYQEHFPESFREGWYKKFFVDFHYKRETVANLHQISPDAAHLIVEVADRICEHRFDLLGSGYVDLGWPIDWHSDFKSGFRWDPKKYFAEIRSAPYPGGYDLKIPWELSRCQHFVWLGQAYWITDDERYAHEFRAEIEDWIVQNPLEYGVNWACSMDIAIRAVNWLWGYAFFQGSPTLDDDFIIAFSKSLLCHGRHIMANLEKSIGFTGNHYLSDIVGLIYLGYLMPELKESRRWRSFGLKELEKEMDRQVYSDGGDFEASTNYHRLVTELFLSATLLARLNGHEFSLHFMTQLEKMLEFIYQITRPDGTVPVIGDQDNGRLHRLKVWEDPDQEWKDFRSLLAIGSVLFQRTDWGKMSLENWEEAIWFYGKESLAVHAQCKQSIANPLRSTAFLETGIYVMRAEEIYVLVDLGSIGQNGNGGHAHNDALSFELFASGRTWIQDPGTYAYTSDYEARNLFRSTAFHNTLTTESYEQNRINAVSIFRMDSDSECVLKSWKYSEEIGTYLAGQLQKKDGLIHTRSFFLDQEERALVITDTLDRVRGWTQLYFHFSPGLSVSPINKPGSGVRLQHPNSESVWLIAVGPGETHCRISESWVSEGYGIREPAMVACFERDNTSHKTVLLMQGDALDLQSRAAKAVLKEKLFLGIS